jgi:hypothetical protein
MFLDRTLPSPTGSTVVVSDAVAQAVGSEEVLAAVIFF